MGWRGGDGGDGEAATSHHHSSSSWGVVVVVVLVGLPTDRQRSAGGREMRRMIRAHYHCRVVLQPTPQIFHRALPTNVHVVGTVPWRKRESWNGVEKRQGNNRETRKTAIHP